MFSAHSWTGSTRLITELLICGMSPAWHPQPFGTSNIFWQSYHRRCFLLEDYALTSLSWPGTILAVCPLHIPAVALDTAITSSPVPFCKLWVRGTVPKGLCSPPSLPLSPPPNPFWVTAICPNTCDALLSTISSSLLTLPKNHAIAFYFSPFSLLFKLGAFLPAVCTDKGGGDRVGMGEGQGTSVSYLTWNQTFFIVLLQPCLYIDLITGLC